MAYNPNNPPGYENMAPLLPTGMTVVNPSSGINLPTIENNDEDVLIKNVLKENETTNSYLKEIRDILLKTFDLDKRKFDNELKLQNKQSFTTAETNLEEKPPVTLVDKEGKDKDKKSIFGDKGDGGGLGGLLKAIFGGALVGLVGAILANPDLLVKIYDGIVNLVDMFGKVADWIGTLDSSTIIIASALAAATALFGPIRTLRVALRAASFAARGATRLIRGTPGQARAGTPGQGSTGTSGQARAGTPGQGSTGTSGQARAGTPGQGSTGTSGQARAGTPGRGRFSKIVKFALGAGAALGAAALGGAALGNDGASPGTSGQASTGTSGQASPPRPEVTQTPTPPRANPPGTVTQTPTPPRANPPGTVTQTPTPLKGLSAANDNITGAAKKILPKGKLAGIIAKKAAKVAIKAVPIVGAVAGIFFAAQRAFTGDWLGATAEAGGVFLPSVAGLPLDASLMARDVYMEVYGTNPEEDLKEEGGKELVGQRFSAIYDGIKDELQKSKESEDKGNPETPSSSSGPLGANRTDFGQSDDTGLSETPKNIAPGSPASEEAPDPVDPIAAHKAIFHFPFRQQKISRHYYMTKRARLTQDQRDMLDRWMIDGGTDVGLSADGTDDLSKLLDKVGLEPVNVEKSIPKVPQGTHEKLFQTTPDRKGQGFSEPNMMQPTDEVSPKTSMEGPSEPNMMQPTDEVSPKTSMEGPSVPNMTGFAADGMSRVQVNKNVIINNITPTTNNIQQDNSTAVISNSKNGGGGVPAPSNYDDSLFSNAAA
jgi:hypothetical protein